MKIGITSDFHGYLPEEVPECDLLLIAGDIGLGEAFGHSVPLLLTDLAKWIEKQPMPIVAVAGNHDFNPDALRSLPWHYLQDESEEICGMKIWGSPWSNPFFPEHWAFNMTEEKQAVILAQIPNDTDIIISHGPPYGSCDLTSGFGGNPPQHVGSFSLRKRMEELPNLKLVACGHIHPAYGREGIVVNGCLVDNKYRVANPIQVMEIS